MVGPIPLLMICFMAFNLLVVLAAAEPLKYQPKVLSASTYDQHMASSSHHYSHLGQPQNQFPMSYAAAAVVADAHEANLVEEVSQPVTV